MIRRGLKRLGHSIPNQYTAGQTVESQRKAPGRLPSAIRGRGYRAARLMTLAIPAASLLPLLGYLVGLPGFPRIGDTTPIAANATISLLILALGAVLAISHDTPSNYLSRHLMSVGFGSGFVLLTVTVIAGYVGMQRVRTTEDMVEHTYEVLVQLDDISAQIDQSVTIAPDRPNPPRQHPPSLPSSASPGHAPTLHRLHRLHRLRPLHPLHHFTIRAVPLNLGSTASPRSIVSAWGCSGDVRNHTLMGRALSHFISNVDRVPVPTKNFKNH